MRQKNTSAYPPHAKHQRAANSRHNSDNEDHTEEVNEPCLLKPIFLRSLTLS